MASELAKKNRVLFISPPIWLGGLRVPQSVTKVFKRILLDHRRRIAPNLKLFSPYLLPRLIRKGDVEASVTSQIVRELTKLKFRNSIFINFDVHHYLLRQIGEAVSIYYAVDPAFINEATADYETHTCQKSDLLLAVSEAYKRKLQKLAPGREVHIVPHGYDYRKAHKLATRSEQNVPKEMLNLKGPIIGYVGSVYDAFVDLDLISFLSRVKPHYNFVFIGPYKNNPIAPSLSKIGCQKLRRLPNVKLLGPKHFNSLPYYIRCMDIGMILHNVASKGSPFSPRIRTPFKLLQYLSQGKPVVSTQLNELSELTDIIYLAKTPNDFADAIDAALQEDISKRFSRMEYASNFSYEKILNRISELIFDFEKTR
ncbi:MAG: glycosyltransferase [Deltaproteobacteria bacterium]|nr:glycosyltransferase [Deltaproteobacteria bacterium]